MNTCGCDGSGEISFILLCGLSPTLGLVRSFPLLEDLALIFLGNNSEVDGRKIPSTSPKLTGCLDLGMIDGIHPAVDRLLELPSGLHFSEISVSGCSDTLESLSIYYYLAGAAFPSPSFVDECLTATFWRSRAQHAFVRFLQAHGPRGCGVSMFWIGRPADHHHDDAADCRVHQPSTDHHPTAYHFRADSSEDWVSEWGGRT